MIGRVMSWSRYDVTVPLGATAAVHVPLMGQGSAARVTEAGAVVWAGGELVMGVSVIVHTNPSLQ
jgi:hypothetical protein